MDPELSSIKLESVTEEVSIVEIQYTAPVGLTGVELMGVDADLSWIKNESIDLVPAETTDEKVTYVGHLQVDDTCEFRARGYTDEEDIWEEGLGNHKIIRHQDGTIDIETHLDREYFDFYGDLPTEFSPSEQDVISRITDIEKHDPNLFQVLVDLSFWIPPLWEDPLNENMIHNISGLMRFIKRKSRKYESYKVDKVVRPVVKALFSIYKDAIEFADDDERLLIGSWEKEGYNELFMELPEKIKELEHEKLGVGKDAELRFKELLEYAG